MYMKQALFGDVSGLAASDEPALHEDGLFTLNEWRTVTACAHAQVDPEGKLSVVRIWRNPQANVLLPENVREGLLAAG